MIRETTVPGIYASRNGVGNGMEDFQLDHYSEEIWPISLRNYADLVLQTDETLRAPVGMVREGIVIIPGEKTLLVRETPLMCIDEALDYEKEFRRNSSLEDVDYEGGLPDEEF